MLTQCPNCKTLFRVSAEQLHAGNGMVRCGFCYGTFNAMQNLTESLSEIPPSNVPDEEIVDELPLIEEQVRIPVTRQSFAKSNEAVRKNKPYTPPDTVYDDDDDEINSLFDEPEAEIDFEPEPPPAPKPAPRPARKPEPKRAPPPPEPVAPKPPKPKLAARSQDDVIASFFETDPNFQHASDSGMIAMPRMHDRPISLNSWNFPTSAWVVAILILTLLIFAQYSYFMRNELARFPSFRPWLETLCGIANCELPMLRDITRISLVSRDMRSHPKIPKALLVRATLVNEASFIQPFPELKLMLSDLNGKILASRQFSPDEYLKNEEVDITLGMTPQTHFDFQLEMLDADRNAVSFEFQFL